MGILFLGLKNWFVGVASPIVGWIGDHPAWTNIILALSVAAHSAASFIWPIANFWALIFPGAEADPVGISLAVVGTGALLAGFAGVVVVFGLQNNSERFRRLRRKGAKELQANWSAMSSSGFWTMGIALLSSLAFSGGWFLLGAMSLELALLFLAHGSVRLMWMFRLLIGVVGADDALADQRDKTLRTEDLPFLKDKRR